MSPAFIDLTQVQYLTWRTFLAAFTPNPKVAGEAFAPPNWSSEHPQTFVEDEAGTLWVFDAVLKLDHNESQRITQHPVQTGANMTDHSFALPAKLTLEIGMSDVMASFIPNQWGSDDSEPAKSVAAYQKLLSWKSLGEPLTITTRLKTYENMVVAFIATPDDKTTKHGLRCMATFQEIFTASVTEKKTSTLPSITDRTSSGNLEVIDSSTFLSNYNIPGISDLSDLLGLQ